MGGVFDSWQEGEQAVQELVDAGYPAQEMAFIPSQDFPSAFQERLRKEGPFWRIMHDLQVTSDEGLFGPLMIILMIYSLTLYFSCTGQIGLDPVASSSLRM